MSDPNVLEALGPFPILQVIAGGICAALAVFLFWRGYGRREERSPSQVHVDPFFVDGPLAHAAAEMKRMADAVVAACGKIPTIAEMRDDFAQRISERSHALRGEIQTMGQSFDRDTDAHDVRLRELERWQAAAEERLRGLEQRRRPPG